VNTVPKRSGMFISRRRKINFVIKLIAEVLNQRVKPESREETDSK
jgi:hypothetical protein